MTASRSRIAPCRPSRPEPIWKEYALLLLLALMWGSSYALIKLALETIPPVTLIAGRVSIAALFLLSIMTWQKVSLPRDRNTWRQLLVQSFLGASGAWTVLAWGQQSVESSLASVLNSTSPIFVFFLTLLFTRHEPVNLRRFSGACLGLLGVVLIVGVDALKGLGQQVVAQLAVILGAVLYGGAAIYGRRFGHLPPVVTATGTLLWASLCLIPLSIALEQPWTLRPSLSSIAAAVTLSLLCTGIGFLIYFRLVRTLGSLGVASQAYLRAGIGVLLGTFVLGESITPTVGLGIAIALLGVILINRRGGG
ncbi:MAG: EamA family transporter [Pseudomonadota bacterium]